VLLIHISNRYIDLEPVLAAAVKQRGLHAALRDDDPEEQVATLFTPSTWVAITRDPAQLEALGKAAPAFRWRPLGAPTRRAWTDDHASILPQVRWSNFLGSD
jgi:hypothetical protein